MHVLRQHVFIVQNHPAYGARNPQHFTVHLLQVKTHAVLVRKLVAAESANCVFSLLQMNFRVVQLVAAGTFARFSTLGTEANIVACFRSGILRFAGGRNNFVWVKPEKAIHFIIAVDSF